MTEFPKDSASASLHSAYTTLPLDEVESILRSKTVGDKQLLENSVKERSEMISFRKLTDQHHVYLLSTSLAEPPQQHEKFLD